MSFIVGIAIAALVFVLLVTGLSQLLTHTIRWVEMNRDVPIMNEKTKRFVPGDPMARRNAFRDFMSMYFVILTAPIGLFFPWITRKYRKDDGRPVIVLIHGYRMTSSAFLISWVRMRRLGYRNIIAINLPNRGQSIEVMTDSVHKQLLKFRGDSQQTFFLVGKSMGGLVVRDYLDRYGDYGHIAGVTTLGSPHKGTFTSFIGRGICARQMAPQSSFIQRINDPAKKPPCPSLAVYSTFDALVVPHENAVWDAADKNIEFDYLGHSQFQNRKAVLDEMLRFYDGEVAGR